jgi:hypothetical protein
MKVLSKWNVVLSAVVMMAAAATAQTSAADNEHFAELDYSLSETADRLLTQSAQRNVDPIGPLTNKDLLPVSQAATEPRSARWRELRAQVEPVLKVQGLPPEVLAVIKVESGGNIFALSPKGARGLWQLMPYTARRYGLVVSASKDERLDPEKATWAATRYLRDLYILFGEWHLAIAAYNAGEDAVARAIAKFGSREFDVLSLKRALPEETRRYVPAVFAEMARITNASRSTPPTGGVVRNGSLAYASTELGE